MKVKNLVLGACVALAFGLVSCEQNNKETKEYLVTFEEVDLGEEGYWNGSKMSGTPVEKELFGQKVTAYEGKFIDYLHFDNSFIKEWGSWNGFACSNHTDTETFGVENQYSTIVGKGANNSKQFAIAYDTGATIECPTQSFMPQSIVLTNSTYAYLYMQESFPENSWFKVSIKGYLGENETGSVDYYLADFRNGKSFLSNKWEKVDISALGEVDKITFHFDSSDKGEYGMNNPAYVCIDNILFTQEIEQ